MSVTQTEDLVGQLTSRLEQLQSEKTELERAVQEQGDGLALKLRLALLAYEQQNPPPQHQHRRKRSKSRSTVSSSPSSSLSTSASTSSSASFPASPSTQISPVLSGPPVEPDVLNALRENESLRVRLANSERVNAYYQRELAELRRRCGISIDELEELDLSGNEGVVGTSNGVSGASSTRRRHRSSSRGDPPSVTTASIRIPGASSVSPPAARLSTSSFPFSTSVNSTTNARYQPQSYTSYVSSVNTTLTTPSSSYPAARAPAPTPATSNAFSPVSGPGPRSSISASNSGAGGGLHARRNSLSALVAAALAQVQEAQEAQEAADTDTPSSAESAASASLAGAVPRGGIDLEDLLHLSSSSSAEASSSSRNGIAPASSAFLHPHTSSSSTTSSLSSSAHSALPSSSSSASFSLSSSSLPAPPASSAPADPLVAAITRSLAKLASADSLGHARTSRRLDVQYAEAEAEAGVEGVGGGYGGGEEAEGEGEGEGSGSSSTTSREAEGQRGGGGLASVAAQRVEGVARRAADFSEAAVGAEDVDAEEDEDGGETPLSVSPGSRSGSLSRRVSLRLRYP
ncbi:hypothetical protein JCM6882_005286 [Rhodosporidiobolus microsporus]